MRILSPEYWIFAAVTFVIYHLFPLSRRWWVLLAASVVFYALGGWQGFAYLLVAAGLTWGGALWLSRLRQNGRKKSAAAVLALVLISLLGTMALLKYWNALADAVNALLHAQAMPLLTVLQPLGLSWFTFQSAGYVLDVYCGKISPERNPARYLLFVSFFPQMAQGPVSTYRQLAPQLTAGHRLDPAAVTMGFQLMVWGCFKKLVLADRLAPVTAYAVSGTPQPGWMPLLGAALYMVRLYADFSGGMDIIRGTALTLGIEMAENFRRPFFATSLAGYWRRWHISLGAWFRTYVLYPVAISRLGRAMGRGGARLLGKRVGRRVPAAFATLVIFLLIGLWHGAYWNAALYGLYFGLLLSASVLLEEPLRLLKKRLKIPDRHPLLTALRLLRTWLLLLVAQFFAFTNGPAQAFELMGAVFRPWGVETAARTLTAVMPALEWSIAMAALAALLAVDLLCERGVKVNERLALAPFPVRWLALLLLIGTTVVLGCYGEGVGSAAFLYTRF